MNEIDSWMTGVNRNVEGKQKRGSCAIAAVIPLTASTAMPLQRMVTESLLWLKRPASVKGASAGGHDDGLQDK